MVEEAGGVGDDDDGTVGGVVFPLSSAVLSGTVGAEVRVGCSLPVA